MRKILLIILIFLSCYVVYNVTNDDDIYFLAIGDFLAKGVNNHNHVDDGFFNHVVSYLDDQDKLEGSNNSFAEKDMRITDLIRKIDYSEEMMIDSKTIAINNLLHKADVITVSVGMNELYYKLFSNNDNIYYYASQMLEDMHELLDRINRYNHRKVIVLGYYNITSSNQDVFNYLNVRLEKMVLEEGFVFVDLDKLLDDKTKYFDNETNFYPNNAGYDKISQIIVENIKNY